MPLKDERYKLRKVPRKDLYWVVDSTGKHYSKEGLPKERAKEQQKALYAAAHSGGGVDSNDEIAALQRELGMDGKIVGKGRRKSPKAPKMSESPVTKAAIAKITDPVLRRLARDILRGKGAGKVRVPAGMDMEGSGIIADALRKAKEVATKVADNIKRVATKGVRTGLPPKARQTMEAYGAKPITSLQVRAGTLYSPS